MSWIFRLHVLKLTVGIITGMRIFAIDHGNKNIGVAVADEQAKVASPLIVIKKTADKRELSELVNLCRKWEPRVIVVGIALNSSRELTPSAKGAKKFAQELESALRDRGLKQPIEYVDESETTKISTQGLNPKRKRVMGDAYAAAAIAERWLQRN